MKNDVNHKTNLGARLFSDQVVRERFTERSRNEVVPTTARVQNMSDQPQNEVDRDAAGEGISRSTSERGRSGMAVSTSTQDQPQSEVDLAGASSEEKSDRPRSEVESPSDYCYAIFPINLGARLIQREMGRKGSSLPNHVS